jgi:hypothetical protein
MFNAIDDEHIGRALLRVKSESKLFLKSREDRCAVAVNRRPFAWRPL